MENWVKGYDGEKSFPPGTSTTLYAFLTVMVAAPPRSM